MFSRRRCRTVSRLLWDFAVGGLSDSHVECVAAHLDRCPACRAEYAQYVRTTAVVCDVRDLGEPESLRGWSELRGRLESATRDRERATAARLPRSIVWATGFAAVAIAALFVRVAGLRPADPVVRQVTGSAGTTALIQGAGGNRPVLAQAAAPEGHDGGRGKTVRRAAPPKIDYAIERKRLDFGGKRRIERSRKLRGRPGGRPTGDAPTTTSHGAKLYLASLDGAGASPTPRRDFVLAAAGPTADSGLQRSYVMGSIPDSGHSITAASYVGAAGEGPVW